MLVASVLFKSRRSDALKTPPSCHYAYSYFGHIGHPSCPTTGRPYVNRSRVQRGGVNKQQVAPRCEHDRNDCHYLTLSIRRQCEHRALPLVAVYLLGLSHIPAQLTRCGGRRALDRNSPAACRCSASVGRLVVPVIIRRLRRVAATKSAAV